jgi:hypothetical protein
MVEAEKQEGKRKEQQEEIHILQEIKEREAAATVKQIERGRGRELTGVRKLGRML